MKGYERIQAVLDRFRVDGQIRREDKDNVLAALAEEGIKAKVRTVCGSEQLLCREGESASHKVGRWDDENLVSRVPSPQTQVLHLFASLAKQKVLVQSDEVGAYAYEPQKGPRSVGIPPLHYVPKEVIERAKQNGWDPAECAVECDKSNYGRERAGFDYGNGVHATLVKDEWRSTIPGLYVRPNTGAPSTAVTEDGAQLRPWGPDVQSIFVDDGVWLQQRSTRSRIRSKASHPANFRRPQDKQNDITRC
jgi:hypothetical protein